MYVPNNKVFSAKTRGVIVPNANQEIYFECMHLKPSFQHKNEDVGHTKRDFDTWRGGRTESQSPVSVTTVEEQKFNSERRKLVIYQNKMGEERNKRKRDKGMTKKVLSI